MISFFLNLLNAPKYVLNYPRLNKLGLQEFRIKSKLKELNSIPPYPLEGDALHTFNELEKNGIVVIHDFLSSAELQILDSQIEQMRAEKKIQIRSWKRGGACSMGTWKFSKEFF